MNRRNIDVIIDEVIIDGPRVQDPTRFEAELRASIAQSLAATRAPSNLTRGARVLRTGISESAELSGRELGGALASTLSTRRTP